MERGIDTISRIGDELHRETQRLRETTSKFTALGPPGEELANAMSWQSSGCFDIEAKLAAAIKNWTDSSKAHDPSPGDRMRFEQAIQRYDQVRLSFASAAKNYGFSKPPG
jgi:hypothetical protein